MTWLVSILLVGAAPFVAGAQNCEGLLQLKLQDTTVLLAQTVSQGEFTPPGGKTVSHLPTFCRVAGVSRPTSDSDIEFEVWLPATGWNGKFQGVGNGGFAGTISYQQLGDAVSHEYASASTNTGHSAQKDVDATWALHHPEKIIDFGYRAIHVTAVNAKAVITAYYGSAAKRSYFSSCSNGGRQALMEAQRFPEDYDGIIAGAPANYWTHLLANAAWNLEALLLENASYIPSAKLPAIQAAALAACDVRDGVKDNVIEDPSGCHFDTSVLLCKGPESDACLTPPQVAALNKLYAGGRTRTGKQVFAGYSPGGEAEPNGWALWITGSGPGKSLMYQFATEFFKNMVFSDPAWDFRRFNVDRDTAAADEKMARDLNANDPDLGRFQQRGGKLILYHGWSDAAIAAGATVDYYRHVSAKMGAAQTSEFVRLFMVPGMEHCRGGEGPDDFGQGGVGAGDERNSIDVELEHWVEGGPPPEVVIASKRGQDGRVVRTRPLCSFPKIAKYKGNGSTDEAQNFVCAASGEYE